MTARREIARSLVDGVWQTGVVDEDTGGNGGSSPYQVADVPVSSAEILALNSSPKTLVAAQGANTIIVPTDIVCVYNFLTSDYTFAGKVLLAYADLDGFLATPLSNDHFTGEFGALTESQVFFMDFMNDYTYWNTRGPLTRFANQPLRLWASGGDPTGGLGSFDFSIGYRVKTLS